jgi:hypothetical protein
MSKVISTPFIALAIFLLLGAGVALGTILLGGSGDVQLQKGLVAHWEFNGNTKDSTPNRRSGTLTGDAAVTANDRKGQANSALTIDGTGDYVTLGDVTFLDGLSEYTVSAWYNFTDISSQGPVVAKWRKSAGGVDCNFLIDLYVSTIRTIIGQGTSCGGAGDPSGSTISTATTADVWHHVVMTKTSTTHTMYYDGALVSSLANAATFVDNAEPLVIGAKTDDGVVTADGADTGLIDDVRIYTRALSAAEVAALYDAYDPRVQVADTQKGLVGHWKFDGNAKDSTPNQLKGTNNGADLTTDRKGQSNKAYDFVSANSDYITLPSGTGNYTSGFAITGWLKTTTTSNGRPLINRRGGTTQYDIFLDNSGTNIAIYTGGGSWVTWTNATVNDGSWHHIALVFSSSTSATMYFDGVSKGGKTLSPAISSQSVTAVIGANTGGSANHFNGQMDDIRLYNRTLSAAEITELYESYDNRVSVSTLQKGLVGNWTFDDAADGTAKDSTPYRNGGTVTGATTTTDRKGQSNKAYSFDGTNDELDVGDADTFSFGDGSNDSTMTITAWINATDTAANRDIVTKWAADDVPQAEWVFRVDSSDKLAFFARDVSAGVNINRTSDSAVTQGSWIHVVVTYDGTGGATAMNGVTLYSNGASIASTATNNAGYVAMEPDTASVVIGEQHDPASNDFNGSIDDVRIYNRVLTAAEITALYESYR